MQKQHVLLTLRGLCILVPLKPSWAPLGGFLLPLGVLVWALRGGRMPLISKLRVSPCVVSCTLEQGCLGTKIALPD